MRVLLDACVPQSLRKTLTEIEVEAAAYAGLDGLCDTDLPSAIEGRFDVLVTLDRNMTCQHRIDGRSPIAIVLRVGEQSPETFQR